MAIIDIERDVVVVRIVYDGPPLSGKTASLKALENILGTTTQLFSPDKAVTDRSIQFNWLEYIGGSFQGREICCQIISVPNYASQECREFLLHSADVVVCVFDAAHISGEEGRKYFEQLHKTLSNRADGLITHTVIQANKQDFSSACSGDDFSAFFHGFSDLHIVESIATTGKGVREGFVLAVRLSIEHVKQLSEIDLLDKGAPDIKTGRELFAYLRTHFIDSSPTESTEFSEGLESLHDLSSHLQGQETLGLTEDESLDSLGNIDVDELADLPIFSKLPEEELVADISDLDELENDLTELEEVGELPEEPVADISDLDELESDLAELEEIGELPEEALVADSSDLDELENDLAELEEIGELPEESVADISDLDELENDLTELEEIGELPEEELVANSSDLNELENDLAELEEIGELPEESVADISDLDELENDLTELEEIGELPEEPVADISDLDELENDLAELEEIGELPEEPVADISDLDELENDLAELEEIGELPEEEPVADSSDLDELENDLAELEEIGELPEEEPVADSSDLDELENDLAELEEIGELPEEPVADISDLDELESNLAELEEIGELPEEALVADSSDLDELENDLAELESVDELPEEALVADNSDLDELENNLAELEEIGELPEEEPVADSSDLDELENDLAELEEIGELPEEEPVADSSDLDELENDLAELESVDELPEEEPVADISDLDELENDLAELEEIGELPEEELVADSSHLDELENDLAELEETGELPEEELVAEISALEELESNFVPLEEVDELADTSKSNELEHDVVLANTLLEQDKVEKPVFPVIDEYAFTDDKQPKPELSGITKVNEIPDSESLIEVVDDVEEQTEEFVQLKSNEASFSQEELSHLKILPEIEETVDIEALSKGTSAFHIVGEVEALDDPVLPPELDEVDNAELTETEIEELDRPVELETIVIDTSSSSIEEEESELLEEENTLPSELADISNDELEASGEELVLPDLSGEEAEADFSHEELQVLKQPFEQDEILEAATDEIDDLDDLVVDEFSGGGAIDEDNSSGSDDELPLSEEEELAMLEESDVLPETAELTDTADQLVKNFTDELAELSEDLDVESDGDEVCVVEPPSIIVPTEKARPNYSKRLPKFPDEYTPTRWIWPPFTGQEILGEIFKYSAMPHRGKSGIWVIDTKNHWRCISKPAWHYHGKDEARDALRQHISIHIKCSPIVSDNRCVAITPDHGDSWRLWQIIFIEETLADSLMRSIDSHDNTVVAQALWETSYYYAEACQACHHYPVEFNLALHNFILNKQRELSYLGSLDNEVEIEKLPHSPITHEQIVEYVKDSFEESIQKIIEHDYDIEALIATLEHIDAGDDMYLLDAIAELLIEAV